MSDIEEPPSKMSRYTDLQYLDECEDALDEGQEEWLSDGVLTEDEYNPTPDNLQVELKMETASQEGDIDAQEGDNEAQDCNNEGQEAVNEDQDHSEATPTIEGEVVESKADSIATEQNIEATLDDFDAIKGENGVAEDLNAFLIRKSDGQVLDAKVKKEDTMKKDKQDVTVKTDKPNGTVRTDKPDVLDNDGNDTDDLLRMLGEDNVRLKKKTLKMVKSVKMEEATSDDEYIFERSKLKTVRLARSALRKQPATKAEPEEMSDDTGAQSTDEASTVKRMFGVNRGGAGAALRPRRRVLRHGLQLNTAANKTETPSPKPIKQYTNKNIQPKSILKSSTPVGKAKVVPKPKSTPKSVEIKTPSPFKPMTPKTDKFPKSEEKQPTFKAAQLEEMIDEEFLDDDGLDVGDLGSESEEEGLSQRIRRPERMDEEAPSDGDSHTEDGSLYDELPSSDSDDMDDWFSLDIRAERAGDYLPLLGVKAGALLAAERGRVRARVEALRGSLGALTASARRQADQLRAAAMALAEIDDTLRAA